MIECVTGCSKKDKVYGAGKYADVSYMCASGVHSGVIPENGGRFRLTIKNPMKVYESAKSNDIQSLEYKKTS